MQTVYRHKHQNATCIILEPTNKGFKTLYTECGKKPKTMYFYKSEFNELFHQPIKIF